MSNAKMQILIAEDSPTQGRQLAHVLEQHGFLATIAVNGREAPPPGDANEDEVSALIETLRRTGRRLEELTAGEVDTVADREGRTLLLRRAQDHLRHSEAAKQAAILNALPAHIALLDTQGLIVAVNEAWRRFAGANVLQGPGVGVGLNYLEICDNARGHDASGAHQAAAAIRSVLAGRAKTLSLEYPCHSPTEQRWFLMTVTPLADVPPNGAVVMHLNITERKRGEEALRRLGTTMDTISDAIYLVDRSRMCFVHVNDAACRLQEQTREELLALEPWVALSTSRAELERAYDNIIASGVDARPLEMLVHRKDGIQIWVELRRHAQRSGDDWTIVTLVRDITERKRVEEEIEFKNTILQTQQETSLDGMLVVDENGQIISYNQQFIDLWRLSPQLVSARLDAPVLQSVADQAENSEAFVARVQYLNGHRDDKSREDVSLKDGRIIDRYSAPVTGADHKYYGRVWYFRDITERKRASQELRESERRFSDLLENVELISMMLDREGRITYCNEYLLHLTGWRHEEVIGRNWFDFLIPPEISDLKGSFFSALLANLPEAWHHENEILTRSGERRLIRWNNSVLRSAVGDVIGTASIGEDITERKEAQDRIAHLNRVYAVLSGINTLIVRVRDRDELFREACRVAVEAGGFRMSMIGIVDRSTMKTVPVASVGKDEALLTAIKGLLLSHEDAPDTMVARAIREKKAVVSNDSKGDPRVIFGNKYAESGVRSMAILPLIVSDEAVGVLALYASESEFFLEEEMKLLTELAGDVAFAIDHIDKQERLDYLAYYDVLTGLPNRALFYDRLEQGTRTARRNEALLAVLSVDLDNFKVVIDTLGHGIGDVLLQEAARRLASCVRDTDTVGRLGGDEFGIILPEIGSSEDAAMVARKVIESCARSYLIEGHELFVSASVGITLFPDDAVDSETLIRNANTATYRAKDLGRNTYEFFTAEMNRSTQHKLRLEADLRYALGKDEFLLYYQPKVSCVTGKITGFEALLRWQHPARGLVGPDEFIPALEETGLIVPVGEWVLASACAQAKSWHDAGLGTPSVAVNISGRQMHLADLCGTVRQALEMSGLAPACLEIELTESCVMMDAENIIGILTRLNAMGVQISVDDFGTGYSSLAYLKRFPIDTLKVDRAFVRDIIADPNDASITRAIITLAHSLKLKVVAEGVETEGQLGLLIANHCDEVQGYYFSRPLPAEDATALLRQGRSLETRMLAGRKQT